MKITDTILDLIFPAMCQLCEKKLHGGTHLCESCCAKLHYVEPPFCQQCGECFEGDIDGDFICPNCHDLKFDFEFARAALHSDGGARKLVHDLKYQKQLYLSRDIAALANGALTDPRFADFLGDSGVIVPIPLHWKRERKRGFNQAEEIAVSLVKDARLPMIKALRRTRNTETQTRLSRAKRLKNLRGAFEVPAKLLPKIKGSRVILVDDVFTTGSTAHECARVLRKNGVARIAVLTLLRG
ncbi:MAG: ComF family protein [Akkermansiaceae bacterium]